QPMTPGFRRALILTLPPDVVTEMAGRRCPSRSGGTSNRGLPCLPQQPANPELEEFAVDSGRAPERICRGHAGDQGLDLGADGRAPYGRPTRERGPVLADAPPSPPEDGVGGYDHEGFPPPGPNPG